MTSSPVFTFRGIYGNGRLTTLDTGTQSIANRKGLIGATILRSGASVGMFCEASTTWWSEVGPYLSGWLASAPATRLICWNPAVWTKLQEVNLPMSGSKDINMVQLRHVSATSHPVWFVCTHLLAGLDTASNDLRNTQGQEQIAAVAGLGTDRWVHYSDSNVSPDNPLGTSFYQLHRDAGWKHQYEEHGLTMANGDYSSFNGYTPSARQAAGAPKGANVIDIVSTSSVGVHAIKHVAGQQLLTDGIPGGTFVSDHNWYTLTSQVIR